MAGMRFVRRRVVINGLVLVHGPRVQSHQEHKRRRHVPELPRDSPIHIRKTLCFDMSLSLFSSYFAMSKEMYSASLLAN